MARVNVTETVVESTTELIKRNIAWKSSSSANDIREWLENRYNPSTPTESTTTTTSSSTSTSSTTNGQTTSTEQTTTTTQQSVAPGSANSLRKSILILFFISVLSVLNNFL